MAATIGVRMRWMDMLRGVAVLLVVIYHAEALPARSGYGVEEWQLLNTYARPFRMALLLFLSGVLLPRGLIKPLPQYLWGKWAAIGWPALVWLAIYGAMTDQLGNWQYWHTGSYLWFLLALSLLYSAALSLKPLVTRTRAFTAVCVLICVVMLVAAHYTSLGHRVLTPTMYFGTFFFLGAGVARFIDRWTRVPGILIAVLAVWAALGAHSGLENSSLHRGTLYAAPTALTGIAVALWVAPRIYSWGAWINPLLSHLEWVGRNSIVLYVVHFPTAVLINRRLMGLDLDPMVHVALCTLGTLVLSVVLTWLRPWTAWFYVFPGYRRTSWAGVTSRD